MKFLVNVFCFVLNFLFFIQHVWASSIDGTTSPKYLTTNQVFHNNQYARGFVKLKSGATILGDATAFWGTQESFVGALDLRDTGTLSLEGDLYFDSNVTLSRSGVIRGNGKTIFLNGNLTIPDNSVIHINSNSIIDGQGHDLVLGRRGKIFVDTNVTLTLQNMRMVQTFNDFSDPCIRLAASKSQLALSDVEFALSQDFLFPQGQLFIHGDVDITGTSAFIYQSPQQSFIVRDGTFYFDKGTTFSFAPSTFTSCLFSTIPTTTTNSFIKMEDQTSKIYFNNCSLLTTLTGCRFTKGSLIFDNKVNLNSKATFDLSSSINTVGSTATESNPYAVTWSPDGRFLAVVNLNSDTLQVFRFLESSNPQQIGIASTDSNPISVSWSPDGRFIAVINWFYGTLQVFSFSGSGNPILVGSVSISGGQMRGCWSPDGRFIAVVGSSLRIYSFSGSGNPTFVGEGGSLSTPSSVSWSPNGEFISVSDHALQALLIFKFVGSGNPTQLSSTSISFPQSGSWSSDGRFISVASSGDNQLQIFKFTEFSNPMLLGSSSVSDPYSSSWSPDGRFIAVAGSNLQIFEFSGDGNPDLIGSASTGSTPYSVIWSPNGCFIALVNYSSNTLQIFKVNYKKTSSLQAISNAIIFGDAGLGSAYDATVKLLAGSNVFIDGLVNYDCVN
ncbi:MAG: beta-propeller fold lactonase family protein [Candidatus Babeliales bacterium]|jgi:WD40 repeat protein